MLGNNLKVHFAGMEQLQIAETAVIAGVRYGLFTVFPFIAGKFGIDSYPIRGVGGLENQIRILKEHRATLKHEIMDSGLFTLTFGAKAGKWDRKFIDGWMHALCEFVIENDIDATCVEVDCQKVLGVSDAWDVRRRMRELLPKRNRMITVFHFDDGKDGLDRLIDYAEYIAISVPELRNVYGLGEKYENAVIRYANYIKNRKPCIDIHLLGCTSSRLLRECRFCTSSDSTSWLSINRFGDFIIDGVKSNWRCLNSRYMAGVEEDCRIAFAKRGMQSRTFDYLSRYVVSAKCCKQEYSKACGGQD